MDKVEEVCSLLNIQLCGQLYTYYVGYLYQQCKCETFTAYIQNFFNSSCMEYFSCPVIRHVEDLCMSGILHLSEDELSYTNLVANAHCQGYRMLSKNGNTIEYSYDSDHYNARVFLGGATATLVMIFMLCCSNSKHFMVLLILIAIITHATYSILDLLPAYQLSIKSAHHPTLRVLEIVPKFVCYMVVNVIITLCMIVSIVKSVRYRPILILTYLVLLTSTSIIDSEITPHYCCHFIPVCI